MESVTICADFYSPRWGHSDSYTFDFSMDRLTITHNARKCTAIWKDNADPKWQGTPLTETMENDLIYPPTNIIDLIEYLWRAWRDSQLDTEQLQTELNALAEYINASTRAKPVTEFWKQTF